MAVTAAGSSRLPQAQVDIRRPRHRPHDLARLALDPAWGQTTREWSRALAGFWDQAIEGSSVLKVSLVRKNRRRDRPDTGHSHGLPLHRYQGILRLLLPSEDPPGRARSEFPGLGHCPRLLRLRSSLLEYVLEGSMPVMASILVMRAGEVLGKPADFPGPEECPFAAFGVFRNATVSWMPAVDTGKSAARKVARRRERPRSMATRVVLGDTVEPACRKASKHVEGGGLQVVLEARDWPNDALHQVVHPYARLDQSEPQIDDLDWIVEGGNGGVVGVFVSCDDPPRGLERTSATVAPVEEAGAWVWHPLS